MRGVSRSSVYAAIKSTRLRAFNLKGKTMIDANDLMHYTDQLYQRVKPKKYENKYLTPREFSTFLGIETPAVYAALYSNRIKFERHRYAYFINPEENHEFVRKCLEKRKKENGCSEIDLTTISSLPAPILAWASQ